MKAGLRMDGWMKLTQILILSPQIERVVYMYTSINVITL